MRTPSENRQVGTHVFDEYPTYEQWIAQFDFTKRPDMMGLAPAHDGHLPVWSEGNIYFDGAKPWKKETKCLTIEDCGRELKIAGKDGGYRLTRIYTTSSVISPVE